MICAFVREQAVTLSLNLLLLTSSATWSKLLMINVTSFTFPKQPRHREKNSAQGLQDRLSVYSYTYSQLVYTYCHWQTAGSELEGHNKTGHAITPSRYHRMGILIVRRHILCFCVECVRSRKRFSESRPYFFQKDVNESSVCWRVRRLVEAKVWWGSQARTRRRRGKEAQIHFSPPLNFFSVCTYFHVWYWWIISGSSIYNDHVIRANIILLEGISFHDKPDLLRILKKQNMLS